MTSEYLQRKDLKKCLEILTSQNELACLVALETGLRINDILSLTTEQLLSGPKIKIIEQKTGKLRKIHLPSPLFEKLRASAGPCFVFTHRLDKNKHRTRQAVWKDIKRAGRAYRIKPNLSPHSLRKIFAVELFQETGDLAQLQKLFNHENKIVTAIYAFSDKIKRKRKDRKPCSAKRAVKE